MNVHGIHSPTHGELRVVCDPTPDQHGRPWRARLEPPVQRLEHLLAVYAEDEHAVLAHILRTVEIYGAQPMVVTGRAALTRPP
jgi:hypothetical protein